MDAKRLPAFSIAADGYAVLRGVESYLRGRGLPARLMELVKVRASQMNGCAFCLDMHIKAARRNGEAEQRLYLLDAWREADLYTPAERAALAWTEALTRVAETHAPDADYEALRAHFSDKEIVDLTIAIGMINLWNRVAVGMRAIPETERAAA